mmetsp:Transcript_139468/g.446194  ORF Transcript_139468/g.446194 Transcript_139468/m.446194 type:complete len:124 (+) Transcript_139468:482-853(+)
MMIAHAEPPVVRDESSLAMHAEYQSADMIEEMMSQGVQADVPGRGPQAAHEASQPGSGQEEALILVQFHRYPKELLAALRTSPALKRCREVTLTWFLGTFEVAKCCASGCTRDGRSQLRAPQR